MVPFLTFWPIPNNRSARGSGNYYFSESSCNDEQFDTLFKEIGVTLFFYSCTNPVFTFDLWSSITQEPWVAFEKEKQFWNSGGQTNNMIYLKVIFGHLDILAPILILWGHFEPPLFQNAQWYQSGIIQISTREMPRNQKQQKNCGYTLLPGQDQFFCCVD